MKNMIPIKEYNKEAKPSGSIYFKMTAFICG